MKFQGSNNATLQHALDTMRTLDQELKSLYKFALQRGIKAECPQPLHEIDVETLSKDDRKGDRKRRQATQKPNLHHDFKRATNREFARKKRAAERFLLESFRTH